MVEYQANAYREIVQLVLGGERRIAFSALFDHAVYEVLDRVIESPHINNRLTRGGAGRKMDVLVLSPNQLLSTMIGRDLDSKRSNLSHATPSKALRLKSEPESGHWDIIILNQCKEPETKTILDRFQEQGLVTDNTLFVSVAFAASHDSNKPIVAEPF